MSKICVLNAALCGRQVRRDVGQVVHCVVKPIRDSTQRRAVAGLPGLVSRLNVPSLWIGGEKDQVMQPLYVRHLAGYAPSYQIEVIAGAGHLPMRDQPDDLAKVLLPWLQRVASPRS